MFKTHMGSHICFIGEKRFECPMCSVVCSDSFSLQEHVELHLDHEAAVNSAGGHMFVSLLQVPRAPLLNCVSKVTV